MLSPMFYGLLMIGTILSIVVLILTIESVCRKVKPVEEGYDRHTILTSATDFADLYPDGSNSPHV